MCDPTVSPGKIIDLVFAALCFVLRRAVFCNILVYSIAGNKFTAYFLQLMMRRLEDQIDKQQKMCCPVRCYRQCNSS